MRVIIGIPCLLAGGTEIQTLNLIKALKSGGHSITTVCYFEWLPDIINDYREAGSEVVCLSQTSVRPRGIMGTFTFLYSKFQKIIKTHRPDIVHIQYLAPGALAALAFRLAGAKKIICTTHTSGDIYSKWGLKIFRFLSRKVFHFTQCISLNSETSYFCSAKLFTKDSIPSKRGHATIYNALPPHIWIQEQKKVNGSSITIGVVSRLEYIKGMDMVIPAFSGIAEDFPQTRLLIVGDGELLSEMKKEAEDSGLSSRISFVGRINKDDIQTYYDKIDIILVPSRSEGFGLTALEGMARGCVPLASATGGLRELITSQCGVAHKAADIKDLKTKLYSLLSDKECISRLSLGALRRSRDFSFDTYSTLINSLYSQI